jgi:hypothetical protein
LIGVEGLIDAPAVDIPWNQSSMSHHDSNMLSLCDCIRKCYDDHLRYRHILSTKPELRRDRIEQDVKVRRSLTI